MISQDRIENHAEGETSRRESQRGSGHLVSALQDLDLEIYQLYMEGYAIDHSYLPELHRYAQGTLERRVQDGIMVVDGYCKRLTGRPPIQGELLNPSTVV